MKTANAFIVTLIAVFSISTAASAYEVIFTPRAATSVEYTDNIFLSSDDEQDELLTIISAGFTLELLEQTKGLEITYDPSYVFYNEYSENDTLRHDAQISGWKDLGRNTRLEITNRFLLTEDPLGEDDLIRDDEVVIPGDTTIRRTRNEYYTNTAIMRINHQFGPENNIYGEFLYSFLRNDDPGIEDNDRYEPSIGLNYWFSAEYGIETRATYTKGKFSRDDELLGTPTDDFEDWFGSLRMIRNVTRHFSVYAQYDHTQRNYDGDEDDDYTLYEPSVGLEYNFDRYFRVTLGLGYFYQDIDNDDNEDGLFGSGEIRKTWDFRRGEIRLTGTTGLRQNDFGAQRLGLERFGTLRTDANYYFTRTFSGDLRGVFNYSDVINPDEADGIDNQKRYVGEAGLSYLPLRWMALRLSYQYTQFDSDVKNDITRIGRTDETYRENRVMFMIVMQADPPWRFLR
jgi:hypothetical protein